MPINRLSKCICVVALLAVDRWGGFTFGQLASHEVEHITAERLVDTLVSVRSNAAKARADIVYDYEYTLSATDLLGKNIGASDNYVMHYGQNTDGGYFAQVLNTRDIFEVAFDGTYGDIRDRRGLQYEMNKNEVGLQITPGAAFDIFPTIEDVIQLTRDGKAEILNAELIPEHSLPSVGRRLQIKYKWNDGSGEHVSTDTYALDQEGWLLDSLRTLQGRQESELSGVNLVNADLGDSVVVFPASVLRTWNDNRKGLDFIRRLKIDIKSNSFRRPDSAIDRFRLSPRSGERVFSLDQSGRPQILVGKKLEILPKHLAPAGRSFPYTLAAATLLGGSLVLLAFAGWRKWKKVPV